MRHESPNERKKNRCHQSSGSQKNRMMLQHFHVFIHMLPVKNIFIKFIISIKLRVISEKFIPKDFDIFFVSFTLLSGNRDER
ncbi:CLUMA_CG010408, isoform A [Clunio marinus]|uniref:CLUMA_CG010408, isoform A n=1 Tax=Clunio marinus TaxID=568069 RepID=A0A1J1IB03_9DIPT|nr:CLUMA_CG010408, isoform A [Clunio marinus]